MRCCLLMLSVCLACALAAGEPAIASYKPPPAPNAAEWPRERLLAFMRELADFVYAHHVVKDEQRATFGMTYEFYSDGKWMQEFGLDSMHDGAWFMSAMLTAQRADPDGSYLARASQYQIPFYVNLLRNSDRLFPEMMPTNEDKKPFAKPVKGWIPRGWDDGGGFAKNTGKPFQPGYHTASNHLAQDVANLLLNVFLTTRDADVAEALAQLQNYKQEYFGTIPVVAYADAFTHPKPAVCAQFTPPQFSPQAMQPYYTGMYELKSHALAAYDDDLAWHYRDAVAAASGKGAFSPGFALCALARAYSHAMATEMFFDDRPYPYGIYFFDIQGPVRFADGKLEKYASTAKLLYGARGIQISWAAAGVLPELKRQPDLWEKEYREKHSREPLVRIVDTPPVTDGERDEIYGQSARLTADKTTVSLLSDPKNLHVLIESELPEVTLQIQPAVLLAGKNRSGNVSVTSGGTIAVTNNEDKPLLCVSAFRAGPKWTAELCVPYTIVPAQAAWINGVECGRYDVSINKGGKQTVYMLSKPERILARSEAAVLGTIAFWHGVWKELGIIPSGYRSQGQPVKSWEISDAGNYAHLIHAIALWLIYQQDSAEWKIIEAQKPPAGLPPARLPDSVLKAQGLR